MAKAMNMRHRKETRRAASEEMAEERATRTPAQQLKVLDTRLGEGMGAQKERAQLAKQIEKSK